MGVGDELGFAGFWDERAQDLWVALGGFGNPNLRKRQPLIHLAPRLTHIDSALEDPSIGHQSNECEQSRPWDSDTRSAVETILEPGTSALMLRCTPIPRINEKVRVE